MLKQSIPALPQKPSYYEMKWHGTQGDYCLSEEEAKKLLKNFELQKDYTAQLEAILDGLK